MPLRNAALLLLTFLWIACDTQTQNTTEEKRPSGPKEGEWVSRREDGSVKTRVSYKNGLKHGKSFLYYRDGKNVQLMMPYIEGKREGTSKKYFKNGSIYAETPYKNDKLNGTRKTYYRNGQLKAAMPYHKGLPGTGLKEYYTNGNIKELPVITYQKQGQYLKLSTSPPCKEAMFYLGELHQNQYFNEYDKDLQPIYREKGNFRIDLRVYNPSYLALQDVICSCKTSQGNPLILKKRIKL